jgi:UDP-galactopyranose mutase
MGRKKILIVGCGLVGSVAAREMVSHGYEVDIWERRDHIAGNLYDYVDNHGILVQKYGPHIFHTNNDNIHEYIQKFSEWNNFNLVCGAVINGKCTPTAFNFKTIDMFYEESEANAIKTHIKKCFPNRDSASVVELLNCEDELVRSYAQFLFDNDYKLYTAKQWAVSPDTIDASVLKRVPIRFNYNEEYFTDKYQELPNLGFTNFIENVLRSNEIHIHLGVDALDHIKILNNNLYIDDIVSDFPVLYTGPLDELLLFKYGRLPYRSLKFEWKYESINSYQEMPVVAYPQAEKFTRITEYKKLPKQLVNGTTYAIEYPVPYNYGDQAEPYYPVPTKLSQMNYSKYAKDASKVHGLYLAGRLSDFQYYNMDQAIEKAIQISKEIYNQ